MARKALDNVEQEDVVDGEWEREQRDMEAVFLAAQEWRLPLTPLGGGPAEDVGWQTPPDGGHELLDLREVGRSALADADADGPRG